MENPEEILHSLEEFAKLRPKDIPRELDEYLCFVAKTGDPVYQWSAVKALFREKLINVVTEFYESCPTVEVPHCPNVDAFNYDSMKSFILEKLDTFAAAPFTVQRICELLTTPRKEYNRIDKYMRALEKNILVVSTTEPGNRRNAENGEGIVNGIENEHLPEIIAIATATNDMMKEMDYNASWPRVSGNAEEPFVNVDRTSDPAPETPTSSETLPSSEASECRANVDASTSTSETVTAAPGPTSETPSTLVTAAPKETEPEKTETPPAQEEEEQSVPAQVQKRRNSIEPITTDDNAVSEPEATDLQPEVVSSETESLSDSSCSNDTVHTDVSDKSEAEEAIQAQVKEEEIVEAKPKLKEEIESESNQEAVTIAKPAIEEEEEDLKIDIVELPKTTRVLEEPEPNLIPPEPDVVQEKAGVPEVDVMPATEKPIIDETDDIDGTPIVEEKGEPTESPSDRQTSLLEMKRSPEEDTPMEVDVVESSDQVHLPAGDVPPVI